MIIESIDKAFVETIRKRGIYKKLRMQKSAVAQYRWRLKNGRNISLDKKVQILTRAGHDFSQAGYSDAELVDLIRFTITTTSQARTFGPEYVLEKWKRR